MGFDLVLKNGVVVDPKNNIHRKLDVGIIDGKIAELSEEIVHGKEVIDIDGNVVIPGVIDMHTHVTSYLGGSVGYKMIAETGVTTTIDFAGPISNIHEDLGLWGAGLNVGSIEAIVPGHGGIEHSNPSYADIDTFLGGALDNGSIGLKLFGGHAPLTREATEAGIEIANEHKVMVALHAGTTETNSDMTGMREAFDMAKDKKLLLAHINAYCRGRLADSRDELKEALTLLRENRNVFSDSHLAVKNGTIGSCVNGIPEDYVTKVCLEMYGFPVTEKGLEEALIEGAVRVIKKEETANILLSGVEAAKFWRENDTNVAISFPVNLPTVAVGCVVERMSPGGDFVIDMTSTDGGGIPRNGLVKRIFSLVQLGYLTIDEAVKKISLNPAKVFGIINKGHLGVGADADITVIDIARSTAIMSFVGGHLNMKNGIVVGNGGRLLVTERGIESAKKSKLEYQLVDYNNSLFYNS